MFKSFYKLAARFGKTDRTHVGDLFVASVFGFCMALHIAPDGKKTHIADKGEMGHAFLLAEKLQENGLASWLLRASTEVLEHHLKLAYNAQQGQSPTWAKEASLKLFRLIHGELINRNVKAENILDWMCGTTDKSSPAISSLIA